MCLSVIQLHGWFVFTYSLPLYSLSKDKKTVIFYYIFPDVQNFPFNYLYWRTTNPQGLYNTNKFFTYVTSKSYDNNQSTRIRSVYRRDWSKKSKHPIFISPKVRGKGLTNFLLLCIDFLTLFKIHNIFSSIFRYRLWESTDRLLLSRE